MDLDPRLRHGSGDRSSDDDGSSTSSPSSQLAATHANPRTTASYPNGAPDDSNTPSTRGTPLGRTLHDQNADQQADADGDPKRSRACEACRGLKVRCEPDPNDEGPCKRCKKAGRNCVITVPTRKRQKKTDSRVAELEKKIDALTASLQSRTGPVAAVAPVGAAQGTNSPAGGPSAPGRLSQDEPSGYGMIWGNGATRHWSLGSPAAGAHQTPAPAPPQQAPPQDHSPRFQPPMVMAGQKRKALDRRDTLEDDRPQHPSAGPRAASAFRPPEPSMFNAPEGDIVDRGLITMEKAAEMFARYQDHMLPHLPAVVFTPSMTVAELRRTKPILFMAIMTAAVSEIHDLQRVLQKELMHLFAEKVMLTGEKSLELVQALQIAVIWYWPPEHFEELKFYQLVHIAAVMAIDIGLGKKAARRANPPMAWREHPFKRTTPPDPTSIECRRAWLACHFMSANTSMALHRPNLIRWTPFMAECMDILEASPDAAPTDKYFCHLVWTHHLAEEVGIQFTLDDPSNVVSLADGRTQHTLKAFERDLDKHRAAVPKEHMQPTLLLSLNVVNLYMHEMALHPETMLEQFRPPFMTDTLKDGMVNSEPLSAAHIGALSACLTAVDGIIETFLGLSVTSTRCLPVFNFVRVAYAVVILLKMYFSASSANSELGRVIKPDHMRVDYYLNALLEKFRTTAADDKCRPAAKFLVVLAMLRSWFYKQGAAAGKEGPGRSEDESTKQGVSPQSYPGSRENSISLAQRQNPQNQTHQAHQQQRQNTNTPLHLLSEVAAGSDSTLQRGANLFAHTSGMRQPMQPFFHQDQGSSSSAGGTPNPSLPPLSGPNDVDLGAAMAPAFPPWAAQMPPDFAMGAAAGAFGPGGGGIPSAGLPLSPETQNAYEGGARMVMNEPWFSDMFLGLPDPNLFTF